jgi:hypothetical protein
MAFIDSGKTFDKEENYQKMKTRMDNLDSVQYPLRIPKALYKKIKIKLATDNKTFRSVLIKMLEEYVNE